MLDAGDVWRRLEELIATVAGDLSALRRAVIDLAHADADELLVAGGLRIANYDTALDFAREPSGEHDLGNQRAGAADAASSAAPIPPGA